MRTCTCNWGGILTPKNFVRVVDVEHSRLAVVDTALQVRSTRESLRLAPTVSLLRKREFTPRIRVDAAVVIQLRPAILWIRFNVSLTLIIPLW